MAKYLDTSHISSELMELGNVFDFFTESMDFPIIVVNKEPIGD